MEHFGAPYTLRGISTETQQKSVHIENRSILQSVFQLNLKPYLN